MVRGSSLCLIIPFTCTTTLKVLSAHPVDRKGNRSSEKWRDSRDYLELKPSTRNQHEPELCSSEAQAPHHAALLLCCCTRQMEKHIDDARCSEMCCPVQIQAWLQKWLKFRKMTYLVALCLFSQPYSNEGWLYPTPTPNFNFPMQREPWDIISLNLGFLVYERGENMLISLDCLISNEVNDFQWEIPGLTHFWKYFVIWGDSDHHTIVLYISFSFLLVGGQDS